MQNRQEENEHGCHVEGIGRLMTGSSKDAGRYQNPNEAQQG
jgi:hypothetical protein